MSENKTVSALEDFKRRVQTTSVACKHLRASEPFMPGDKFPGFNIEQDIETDFAAWCDKCEDVFRKEEYLWTEKALKFADFDYCCAWCFEIIRQEKIKRMNAART